MDLTPRRRGRLTLLQSIWIAGSCLAKNQVNGVAPEPHRLADWYLIKMPRYRRIRVTRALAHL
ncbi:exported hypothetical protein [Thiomonas sp. CB3]|nr:exported hypothetical protein [Thiomonas sp. CB3]